MSLVAVNESTMTDIADALREKKKTTDTYKPKDMAQAVRSIVTNESLPKEAFELTGVCQYRFANNCWNWFIEQYGSSITTKDITNANNMFYNSGNLTNIPFDLNLVVSSSSSNQNILTGIFQNTSFSQPPNIYIKPSTTDRTKHKVVLDSMFSTTDAKCKFDKQFIFVDDGVHVVGLDHQIFKSSSMEEVPQWMLDMVDIDTARTVSVFGSAFPTDFGDCRFIKKIPQIKEFYNDFGSYYSHWYYMNFNTCYSLQEIVLPRPGAGTRTSGSNPTLSYTHSLKRVVFDTQEDGTPYTANWKNVTLQLDSVGVSFTSTTGSAASTLDMSKKVTDDESYQLLKNDPAYWDGTGNRLYCAYNHDAAVETINSLPDTSAYGTNTVRFKGIAGSNTDGGAINTLTPEEIAIATSKGWTVTFN